MQKRPRFIRNMIADAFTAASMIVIFVGTIIIVHNGAEITRFLQSIADAI